MCWSEKVVPKVFMSFGLKDILERQWSTRKDYVMQEKVREFLFLGDRIIPGGRCWVTVTAR